ncbi:MAG: hypothetical protein ACO1OB_03430 [Archangium sp.]
MRLAAVLFVVLPSAVFAQQSVFNVPSAQETVPGRLFGQVQFTGTEYGGEVNTTIELGVFKWLEVGVNLFHMHLYRVDEVTPESPATSSTMLNANFYFEPTDFMSVEAGGQGGIGFIPTTLFLEPVLFGFAAARFDAPGRWGSYIVGGYTGTRGALGKGPPGGGLLAFEIPLWEHVIHAQGDWLIGVNEISVAVVGAVVFIGKNFQVSAGVQLPSPGSGNHFGGVLELTYVPTPPEEGEGLGHGRDRAQQRRPSM